MVHRRRLLGTTLMTLSSRGQAYRPHRRAFLLAAVPLMVVVPLSLKLLTVRDLILAVRGIQRMAMRSRCT